MILLKSFVADHPPFFFSQQEESQRILAINSDLLSSQTRSCKDEPFLNISPFQKRLETLGQF